MSMFNLDEIFQQKFISPSVDARAAVRGAADLPTANADEKKRPRKDNFTKVEPYEYGSITIGDYIKYIGKSGDLKGGIVKKIQINDGNFEIGLAKGNHFWYINNNNAKEIRIKYASKPRTDAPKTIQKAVSAPESDASTEPLLRRIEKLEEDNRRMTKLLSIMWQKIKDK